MRKGEEVRWLLYSKTLAGSWTPVFGLLSEFAGGLVMYALMLLAPAYVIWHSMKKMRRSTTGPRGYKWVIAWAAGAWLLFILWSVPHAYPRGSPGHAVALVIATGLSVPYLILGLCKVLPFVVRARKGDRRDLSAGQPRA